MEQAQQTIAEQLGVNVEAAVALVHQRAETSGWAEWDDLCEAAGIKKPDDLALSIQRWARWQATRETALLDGLRFAHVRLVRMYNEPARLVTEDVGGVELWRGMGAP